MKSTRLKQYSFPVISSIFLTVIPIIFSSVITFLVIEYQGKIEQFSSTEWFFMTVICCVTSVIAFTPPTFLALVFGYFLSWKAIMPLFFLNMGAIFLINIIVRRFDKEKLMNYFSENPKVKTILNNLHKEELKLIFFTKLSPVMPFSLTNLVFTLSGAKLKNILLGGFLGMIPRTILAIWTGAEAKEIKNLLENPNEGNINKIILIVLIISSLAGVYLVFRRVVTDKK